MDHLRQEYEAWLLSEDLSPAYLVRSRRHILQNLNDRSRKFGKRWLKKHWSSGSRN
jgi:hypothetical protein